MVIMAKHIENWIENEPYSIEQRIIHEIDFTGSLALGTYMWFYFIFILPLKGLKDIVKSCMRKCKNENPY